jgi:hypothetical protein
VGYNAEQPTFRGNMSPPYSGSMNKPSKEADGKHSHRCENVKSYKVKVINQFFSTHQFKVNFLNND